jgi:hypothetical protein
MRYVKCEQCRLQLKGAVLRDMWLTSGKCDLLRWHEDFFLVHNVGCI